MSYSIGYLVISFLELLLHLTVLDYYDTCPFWVTGTVLLLIHVDYLAPLVILACWTFLCPAGRISGLLDIPLACWTYLWPVGHTSGLLNVPLVCWTYLRPAGHISGLLEMMKNTGKYPIPSQSANRLWAQQRKTCQRNISSSLSHAT